MAVTIKDVARRCNVSVATVSRVINNKTEGTSEATRQLIWEAVQELDYRPSLLARGLVTKKTGMIGLVIPDIRNPFFSELAWGVEDLCNHRGYSTIVCNTDGDLQKETDYVRLLQGRFADGVVFTTQNNVEMADFLPRLLNEKYPFVFVERYVAGLESVPGVYVDNHKGAFDLTQFLIDHGHRKIAFISGPLTTTNARLRLSGFRDACDANHVPIDDGLIREADYRYAGGYEAMRSLLKKRDDFTAVFGANDLMAFGGYRALQERGIEVPAQVSVAGFDNTTFLDVFSPQITTMEIPAVKIGRKAAQLLIDLLSGKQRRQPAVTFDLQLVDKGSVIDITDTEPKDK